MCPDNKSGGCAKVGGFSTLEKVYSQSTFYLTILVGTYGLGHVHAGYALAYLAYALGSFTLLVRYTVCARCPHLLKAHDCLFLPQSWARKIIAPGRSGRMNGVEKGILYAAFFGTFIVPVLFIPTLGLMGLFALFSAACVLGLVLHTCKRCRNVVCPFNRLHEGA